MSVPGHCKMDQMKYDVVVMSIKSLNVLLSNVERKILINMVDISNF